MPKVEAEKKQVIFRTEANFSQRSKANLIFVLNKLLQRAGIPTYTRFSKVRYLQSRAILVLFTKKSNTKNLIKDYSKALIRAAKSVHESVIKVEVLKRWQKLKIYRMFLLYYFGERKIELLYYKIKSFTKIKLKTISR